MRAWRMFASNSHRSNTNSLCDEVLVGRPELHVNTGSVISMA